MRRATHPRKAARILLSVADGSIKIMSPVTGAIIGSGFPAHKDTMIKDIAYDMNSGTTPFNIHSYQCSI